MNVVRGLTLVVTACACLSLAACTTALPGPDHYYHNFETAAAKAPSQGYTVYWLGRQFKVAHVTYTGPTAADFGAEFDDGGLGIAYDISEDGKPAGGDFLVSMYTPAAWRHVAAEYETPYSKEISFQNVTVAGHPAKLVFTKYLVGPLRATSGPSVLLSSSATLS